MYKVKVKIQGSAPLLMHKFSTQATAELEGAVKSRKTGPPPPDQEAEEGAYRLDSTNGHRGQLCVPGEHVYQTAVKAASSFQIKGQGKKTFKDPVKGSLEVYPEYAGITNPKTGDKVYDYIIDKRPARIGTSRVLRCRPRLEDWSVEFELRVLDERMLPPEVLQSILVRAGQCNGIGDYRPRFGKFFVPQFEILEFEAEKDLEFEVPGLPDADEESGSEDGTTA